MIYEPIENNDTVLTEDDKKLIDEKFFVTMRRVLPIYEFIFEFNDTIKQVKIVALCNGIKIGHTHVLYNYFIDKYNDKKWIDITKEILNTLQISINNNINELIWSNDIFIT